jgi:hypothetical protein
MVAHEIAERSVIDFDVSDSIIQDDGRKCFKHHSEAFFIPVEDFLEFRKWQRSG